MAGAGGRRRADRGVRVTVRTSAGKSAAVMRTLRAALTRALDAAGIGSTA
jgi:hypothetical protein